MVLVALVSAAIRSAETAPDTPQLQTRDWVRTIDGWERRSALSVRTGPIVGNLHPATVASFQLSASLLCLAAYPTAARSLEGR